MPQYRYPPLSPEPDTIRLLRLMPHQETTAPIQCQLFEYPLKSGKGVHLYEALSYVWGGSDKSESIFIDQHDLPVTPNLHAALLRLRDHFLERIIWVDAICINQEDLDEKSGQVQSMGKIYSKANRVVVWLGEAADDSDQALEEIRLAVERQSTKSSPRKINQKAIFALLARTWFRRIWILQEVALARDILIICGSTEIDGYTFCLGLKLSELSYESSELQNLIRTVTYLIRGAICRPRHATSSSSTVSTDARPLGELIDMYHIHEASRRHDKVYALLGMSSDGSGLSPNYNLTWEQLLSQLFQFLLCKEVSVETLYDIEIAGIRCKGWVLGQVSSVERDIAWDDIQNVAITSKNTSLYLGYNKEWSAHWTLQASAKSILEGDIICLLQGASKPTIIRRRKDYFVIITIAATPTEDIQTESGWITWSELLRSIETLPRDLLLMLDWEKSPEGLQDRGEYEMLRMENSRAPEHLEAESGDHSGKSIRLQNMARVLADLEEYDEAVKVLRLHESMFEKDHLCTLACKESIACAYKSRKEWEKAEELFKQIIETRQRVQGEDHSDTLSSRIKLASLYRYRGDLRRAEMQEMAVLILKHGDGNSQITDEQVVQIANSMDKEIVILLLDRMGDKVHITEEVLEAAAGNQDYGREEIRLLLERMEGNTQITENVLEAAAWNGSARIEVLRLLLKRMEGNTQITEKVLEAAAGYNGEGVTRLLLERMEGNAQITEKVLEAAAGNIFYGWEVTKLLLERMEGNALITEEVLEAAARNLRVGSEVTRLLLERIEGDAQITEKVLEAAGGNWYKGEEVTRLLLDRMEGNAQITEKVLKAAARNRSTGIEVIRLLLERMEGNALIIDKVLKAAAGN